MIIGCGRIAGGGSTGKNQLTHAFAFKNNNKFELKACVDSDHEASQSFQKRWGVGLAYTCMRLALEEHGGPFDVISICSPDDTHEALAIEAIKSDAKVVVLEKPVALTREGVRRISDCLNSRNCRLLVNFPRRYAPGFKQLRKDFLSGRYGEIRKVVGIYNKGLRHNGVHHIDLAVDLFGGIALRSIGEVVVDYDSLDPTVDLVFDLPNGSAFHLVGTNCQDYALFEMLIYTSTGTIIVNDLGFRIEKRFAEPSQVFKDFKTLGEPVHLKSEFELAFSEMVADVERCLTYQTELQSGLQSSLLASELIHQVHGALGI
ncbi:hypothetical protein TH24_21160 [Thalassospira xiamenensis]|nr:hypothetical protein TH24_21160 [Thalassospira xiamenensis]